MAAIRAERKELSTLFVCSGDFRNHIDNVCGAAEWEHESGWEWDSGSNRISLLDLQEELGCKELHVQGVDQLHLGAECVQ